MFCPLNFVFWPGLISLFRLFAWRFFAVLSFLVASFRYFVFPHGVFRLFARGYGWGGGRKDEITPLKKTPRKIAIKTKQRMAKRQNNEKTPGKKTKNKSLKLRYFAYCAFRVFALVFRHFA